eukprot:CAMPEP_0172883330 /NCGR_PEP_ID=MMETSP1075-20121228/122397_1 /TAXON_ID=2916 /ORGANISM="Ceratium fusus, Strain PA161109" /LENGTH=45 /DNA_ID= /DNA_START= /DNA_END= /DNA_ORIENTATION=
MTGRPSATRAAHHGQWALGEAKVAAGARHVGTGVEQLAARLRLLP